MLSHVSPDVLARITKVCTWHQLVSEEVVIVGSSGSPHGVYFLVEGVVQICRHDVHDDVATLAELTAPECFGEFNAISVVTGAETVRAKTDCVVAELSNEQFMELLTFRSSISLHLLKKAISLIRGRAGNLSHFKIADAALEKAHRSAILRSL
jgi:CRP-like cAMP-binding protein